MDNEPLLTRGAPFAPGEAPSSDDNASRIDISRGFGDWLRHHAVSLAFSSYQSGQLFLIGAHPNGTVSINQQNFQRSMGLCWSGGRLYLGGLNQIWRLENVLRPGEYANEAFDALLVPRNAQTVGDVDIHEAGVDDQGRVVFVNTKYSCLCVPDLRHSFRPIWKPPFISRLAPEDRCHLNGMAMVAGRPILATAVSRSDGIAGWRERRHEGGVLIRLEDDQIVTDQLSMPHSPRLVDGRIWLLDSGRGWIVSVDPSTGRKDDIAFCPGFLRGMALHDGFAIVTVSKPRDGSFKGLLLDTALRSRDLDPWCGVLVVDLSSGHIVEWLRLHGGVTELFDVVAMPGVACPMAVGPLSVEMSSLITFETDALK